jgi:hypothetical protein
MTKKSETTKGNISEDKGKVTEALPVNDRIIIGGKKKINQFKGMDERVDEALPITSRIILD